MAIDVGRARAETPGCAEVVHFNNAGAALAPQPVLDAMLGHLDLEARIGGYEAAERGQAGLHRVYASIARLLNCSPGEVALVESATRAWDMAFYALPFAPGDRILTSRAEYASNYIALLQVARRTGAVIEVIPDDATGQVSLDALGSAMDGARLVALTHVPTNGGLVNPAADVGRLARAAGVLYLLDACQSVGQMPIDIRRDRLRHALGHGSQVFARAARHGFSVRPPGASTAVGAAVSRLARGDLDRAGQLRAPPRCATL